MSRRWTRLALLAAVCAVGAAWADFDVYFLRHGETYWNRSRILQGSLSFPELTERGVAMADETARGLKTAGLSFDRIYTSPYKRAVQTAEIVAAAQGVKPVVDARLREMCFGKYEGVHYSKGNGQDENLRSFFEAPERYVPQGAGAESPAQVGARLRDFLEHELVPQDGRLARILCVAHSLVLKNLLKEMFADAVPASAKQTIQRNCCLHVLRYSQGKFSLVETGKIFYDPARFESVPVPLLVSHRGDYPDCPEGTRPAYSNAVVRGADVLKMDVQDTRDHVIVMSHDDDLKRTMGWSVPITQVTYAEICEHTFKPKGAYGQERIVPFTEALWSARRIPQIWLDFKHFTPEFAERVLTEVTKAGIDFSRVMVATYTQSALRYMKEHHPEIRRIGHMHFEEVNGGYVWSFDKTACGRDLPSTLLHILAYRDRLGLWGVNVINRREVTAPFVAALKKELPWVSIAVVQNAADAHYHAPSRPTGFVTGNLRVVRAAVSETLSEAKGNRP